MKGFRKPVMLSKLPRPFIVCVLTDRSVVETITTMRLAEIEGAEAYEVNLPVFGDLPDDGLAPVFSAVKAPVYTSCRRKSFMAVYGITDSPDWNDEIRMNRQIEALKRGSVAMDMELDTFDPHPAPALGTPEAASFAANPGDPAEITYDMSAIARQQEVINIAHEHGGEVICSCHTGRPQPSTMLIGIAEIAVKRGADLVKIVSPCPRIDDLYAILAATTHLAEHLTKPFILVGAGKNGELSRFVGANLGSSWLLAQYSYKPGGFHGQPLIHVAREVHRLIPWHYQGEN